MNSFPPRHICIAGSLLIAAAVGSVTEMLVSWSKGGLNLNLGFLAMPIGYGLLIGRPISRKLALFFSGIALLFIGAGGLWLFLTSFALPYPDSNFFVIEWSIIAACCLYVFIVLITKQHREWFEATKAENPPLKSFCWSVAVVTAVLHITTKTLLWWTEETLSQVYSIHTKVTPYNIKTGEGLKSLSFESAQIKSEVHGKVRMPKLSVSSQSGGEGMELEFSGVAVQPVTVTLKSEGYQANPIILNAETESELRIPMQPLEPALPQSSN
ncbi:MAG: hypothetical protein IPK32_25805 [Verrucomicrobiaceae bacterium]|nr:hypothetical protein [Verrucomicrobiaceae bacterium]